MNPLWCLLCKKLRKLRGRKRHHGKFWRCFYQEHPNLTGPLLEDSLRILAPHLFGHGPEVEATTPMNTPTDSGYSGSPTRAPDQPDDQMDWTELGAFAGSIGAIGVGGMAVIGAQNMIPGPGPPTNMPIDTRTTGEAFADADADAVDQTVNAYAGAEDAYDDPEWDADATNDVLDSYTEAADAVEATEDVLEMEEIGADMLEAIEIAAEIAVFL